LKPTGVLSEILTAALNDPVDRIYVRIFFAALVCPLIPR
jgi:hypothetical protein